MRILGRRCRELSIRVAYLPLVCSLQDSIQLIIPFLPAAAFLLIISVDLLRHHAWRNAPRLHNCFAGSSGYGKFGSSCSIQLGPLLASCFIVYLVC